MLEFVEDEQLHYCQLHQELITRLIDFSFGFLYQVLQLALFYFTKFSL